MSALSAINSVYQPVFQEYGEDATYTTRDGVSRSITAILLDPSLTQDIAGQSIEGTNPAAMVKSEDIAEPSRGDLIQFERGQYEVRSIERHSIRGYWKLTLKV